ncbi:hypothetical protein Tco_1198337 [Tanacetum coccineum]
MTKLAFYDYHNMVAILEKTESNTDFHQIVDFLEASHIRYALTVRPTVYVSHIQQFWSTARVETVDGETKIIAKFLSPESIGFNEFSSNIATAIVCLATNRVYNFSKMIFDGMVRNIKSKVKFLMFPRFIEFFLKMGQFGVIKHTETYDVPFHTQKVFTTLRVNSPSFSGRTVQLFESMLVPQGEGSENPTEPHHTPSAQYESTPQEDQTTSPEPIPQATTLPSQSHPDISTPRRLTRGAIWISQSKAPTPGADETASPTRDDRHREAFPTATSLDAGQDRENIAKTSAMPHEASPGVTSLGGGEGKSRPRNHSVEEQREDLITRDVEKSTEKGSDNTNEAANVLSTLEAANFSPPAGVATASVTSPYTRRTRASRGIIIEPSHTTSVPTISAKGKGKEKMVESTNTKEKKIQEQLDAQVAKEAQAERELGMMIAELDRSNELIAKYMNEYEQAEADLSLEEKMKLITELIKYQRNLSEIKKYQAQQSKPATKTEKRTFYMAILKSHAGWKCKDFRGMTFEQIEEKFILLAQESSKRLKTAKASRSEPSQEQQTKDPKELSEEELKKMMEIVPIEEVYIEALQAKYPIIE